MNPLFGFFGSLGTGEIIVLLIIGVILFGRRLPEVGRYLGKGIVEFKKGLHGLEDEVNTSSAPAQHQVQGQPATSEQIRPPQRVVATAPKFEDNAGAITTPPRV